MVGIEDERLMLMLRYFSICFHIPLSNRDVSTNGYFICGFSEIGLDDLHSENGLSILFENLDKHLSKDELYDILDKFEDFENFVRKNGQSINEYVALFDSKYKKVLKKSLVLPSEILAFRLINRANITRHERLLILSGFDFGNRSSLYEQAVKLLKKFIGDLEVSKEMGSVRLEPAY